MKNIVAATFQPGYTTAKVLGLWQYDYGQILRIQGLELPDTIEIHFSLQEKGGESERQVGVTRDGVTEVSIPNSYLENAGTSRDYSIYAFLYISDGKSGNTEYKITMHVQSRPKPKDPETPEDPKKDPFGETVEVVNKAMESARASAEAAAESEKSASESAARAEKSAVESQKSAESAAESEKAAATSATAAAESASQSRESAAIASSAADQAAKSATAAAESATTAAQLAENATRSATNASGSAESASQSAETAKTAADAASKSGSAAQQAAGSASESASTATAAAQTATTAAGKAAGSATSASQSAENAGQKATAAETAAGSAAESETEAAKSATAAGDSASAAKTSETAAEEAAQTAQEQAEKIKASAEQIEKNKTDVTSLKEDLNLLKEYVKGTNIPKTWEQVALAIKSKLHKEMYAVGDKFSNIWKDTNNSNKEYDNPLRISHFEDGLELEDGTTVNGMWLQTVYAHLKGVQFSHQQAFYVSDEGMTAGTYCIGFDYTWGNNGYVNKGDYWNFTLTKDVPAGGKLAGYYGAPDTDPKNWRIYIYSADGKTVLETVSAVNKGQEGNLLGVMTTYGDENLNGIQQMAYGDNRYATSAIRQYLNSDKPKGEWWTAQTKWDIAPDQLNQIDGYLCGIAPELLTVLKPVKVVTYCNTVTATGKKQVKDITYDKVTLISLEQMYIESQAAGEGEAHEYYKELNGTDAKFKWWHTYEILKTFAVESPTSHQSIRLRSANRTGAHTTGFVYSIGYVGDNNASGAFRPAPLMFIGAAPSDTISAPTDAESAQKDKTQETVA
nr:MAG TPA: hypothetical protein [Caudoviricetes sp.]